MNWIFQLIFTFSLFLLLFIGHIALFNAIHGFYYTIQLIFNFFFLYFLFVYLEPCKPDLFNLMN